MPTDSILRGFGGPTWNLAQAACERNDVSLIEEVFSHCSPQDDPPGLLRYSCRHAIQNNADSVLNYLLEKQGLDVRHLPPTVVAGEARSTAILEILLSHGWDINWRKASESGPDAEPFMWHVVGDEDLVPWCLDHGASVTPAGQEPLRNNEITKSQYCCSQVLECAAARGSIATFELLRSKGAPLGWRPLHLAVRTAALALTAYHSEAEGEEEGRETSHPSDEESKSANAKKKKKDADDRMSMVRHLIDSVGINVNALDYPAGQQRKFDRLGTPIVYLANLPFEHTRELTWLLLDRGADPAPGLEEAREEGHPTFAEDVEAWREEHPGGRKSWWGAAKTRVFG